jgi:hypothetical protein
MDNGSVGPDARTGSASDDVPLKLEEFLPYRLNVAAALVSEALSRVYGERHDLGIPEWRVVATLGQFGTMTGKEIGAHAHMHKTKVSRAVAVLARRKLAGRAIYEDIAPVALALARRFIEAIDPADRAAFDRALKAVTARAKKLTQ